MSTLQRSSVLAVAAMVVVSTGVLAATPLTGEWAIQGSRTVSRFQPCGEATCAVLERSGKIIRDPDIRDVNNPNPQLRSRPLKGLVALQDLRPSG